MSRTLKLRKGFIDNFIVFENFFFKKINLCDVKFICIDFSHARKNEICLKFEQ